MPVNVHLNPNQRGDAEVHANIKQCRPEWYRHKRNRWCAAWVQTSATPLNFHIGKTTLLHVANLVLVVRLVNQLRCHGPPRWSSLPSPCVESGEGTC